MFGKVVSFSLSFMCLNVGILSVYGGTCQVGLLDDSEVIQFPLAVGECAFQEDTPEPEGDGSYSIECINTDKDGIVTIGTIYADTTTCMDTDDIESFQVPGDCSNTDNNCQLIEITRVGYVFSDCSGTPNDQIDTIIITTGANQVCIDSQFLDNGDDNNIVYYSYMVTDESLTLFEHVNNDCSDEGTILFDAFNGECIAEQDIESNPAAFIHSFRLIDDGNDDDLTGQPSEEPTKSPNRI